MIHGDVLKFLASAGIEAKAEQLEKPPQPDFGDVSFPCFHLAKVMRKSPVQIALDAASKAKIPKGSLVSKVEAKGAYINFFFDYSKFAIIVLKDLSKKPPAKKGRRVMVEYSSPNPVHPMHIGSSRNTFLGAAFSNVLEFNGDEVIRANYINNVGLQVAKLVTAYQLWGDGKMPEGKPDVWLWKYYVRFHEEEKGDKKLEDMAKSLLRKYELEGDGEVKRIWDKVVGWCIEGFKETYARAGVDFDEYFYEIDYREPGKRIVEKALESGIARRLEDGAVLADMEGIGLNSTIIQRSDGTGLYITSDLGLTAHKFAKFKLDEAVWVAGAPQELHFRQMFKIMEATGHKFAKDCRHLSYEIVGLSEGKMSSREGRAVMLDEVLDRLTNLAHAEVDKRNPEMPEGKKRKIASQIALGALKYAILRIEPQNQITFDWDQMLSLEGNTGPYLQYAHTRCLGILEKAGKFTPAKTYKDVNEYERTLLSKLSEFGSVVESSAREMRVNGVCNYGYELATAFNSFYHNCHVMRLEDRKQTDFRLALVKSTEKVLRQVFDLIGMEAPEKM